MILHSENTTGKELVTNTSQTSVLEEEPCLAGSSRDLKCGGMGSVSAKPTGNWDCGSLESSSHRGAGPALDSTDGVVFWGPSCPLGENISIVSNIE